MNVLFEERQHIPPWGMATVVAGVGAAIAWLWLVSPDRHVRHPLELLAVIAFTAGALTLIRMRTTVTSGGLRVAMFFVPRKSWAADEIERCEVVTYRPFRDYLGWGFRWTSWRGWAYTMGGTRGVMVFLDDGRSFLVGSRRPDELAAAIEAATRGRSSAA